MQLSAQCAEYFFGGFVVSFSYTVSPFGVCSAECVLPSSRLCDSFDDFVFEVCALVGVHEDRVRVCA